MRALAKDHQADLGMGASDDRERLNEPMVALVSLQSPDGDDERRTRRDGVVRAGSRSWEVGAIPNDGERLRGKAEAPREQLGLVLGDSDQGARSGQQWAQQKCLERSNGGSQPRRVPAGMDRHDVREVGMARSAQGQRRDQGVVALAVEQVDAAAADRAVDGWREEEVTTPGPGRHATNSNAIDDLPRRQPARVRREHLELEPMLVDETPGDLPDVRLDTTLMRA